MGAALLDAAGFARVAGALSALARRAGLAVPAFRSPPRRDARRTIRRLQAGPVVAVRRGRRPAHEVVADLVDGILAANDLLPPAGCQRGAVGDASRAAAIAALRRLLLAEALAAAAEPGPPQAAGPPSRLTGAARVAERQTHAA